MNNILFVFYSFFIYRLQVYPPLQVISTVYKLYPPPLPFTNYITVYKLYCLQIISTVYKLYLPFTSYIHRLQVISTVYQLYPLFTNYIHRLQVISTVYKLYQVISTVYKLYPLFTNYIHRLQVISTVYKLYPPFTSYFYFSLGKNSGFFFLSLPPPPCFTLYKFRGVVCSFSSLQSFHRFFLVDR